LKKWIKPIKHEFLSSVQKELPIEKKEQEDFSFINIIPNHQSQDDKILEEGIE
jgi:hypothetical protein